MQNYKDFAYLQGFRRIFLTEFYFGNNIAVVQKANSSAMVSCFKAPLELQTCTKIGTCMYRAKRKAPAILTEPFDKTNGAFRWKKSLCLIFPT